MLSGLFGKSQVTPVDNDDVTNLSQSAGINIAKKDVADYRDLINGFLKSADLIYDIPEVKPNQAEVSFPRNAGKRPQAKDNPYNAWYMKTEIKGASSGVLAGKRIAIKDNIAVAGVPMMDGCRLLEGHVPDYDATVVTRILQNGGTIAGKAVCENLTCAGNSFTSATGPVLNPFDKTRTSGGSSSGSAVLVATGEVDMAIGSDSGGSIRVPASFCGIVGLKPTFGLVPTTGTVGVYPSFDHVGPMAKTVTDCATLLQINDGVNELRVGLLKEGFEDSADDVTRIVRKTLSLLEDKGASLKDVSVPYLELGGAIFGNVVSVGLTNILVKNGGISIGTGQWHDTQVSERLQLGVKVSPEYLPEPIKLLALIAQHMKEKDHLRTFAKAENLIPAIRKAFDDAFKDCDVIVLPTATTVARKLPLASEVGVKEIVKACFGLGSNTSVFNLTGHPAISVNAGFSNGLPVGVLVVGPHWKEDLLLRVARAIELLVQ